MQLRDVLQRFRLKEQDNEAMEKIMDKPLRRSDVRERKVGTEYMLYDTFGRVIHVLNETAQFIWQRCDGEHSVSDIIAEAIEIYDVSEEQARSEIEECLETFRKLSVI